MPNPEQETDAPDPVAAADELGELPLGPPFAIVHDCDVLERGQNKCEACQQPNPAGPSAVVRCECTQLFRINLLASEPSKCPKCGRLYTHVFLMCAVDNTEVFPNFIAGVLHSNGYRLPEPDEPEDEDEDEPEPEDEDETEPEPGDK